MSILGRDESVVFFEAPHGERITEWIGQARQGPGVRHSVAEVEVPPGKASLRHTHPVVEESYCVFSGTGEMELGDARRAVGAGDAVLIRPGVPHKIRNTGEAPLRMVVTCVPAWTPDCSVFEETWDPEAGEVVPLTSES